MNEKTKFGVECVERHPGLTELMEKEGLLNWKCGKFKEYFKIQDTNHAWNILFELNKKYKKISSDAKHSMENVKN